MIDLDFGKEISAEFKRPEFQLFSHLSRKIYPFA